MTMSAVAMLSASLVSAQIQIWPHRLQLPAGNGWWFAILAFSPLIAFPLESAPRITVPLLLAIVGAGIITAAVCWQPEPLNLAASLGLFLFVAVWLEPRIMIAVRRLLRWLAGRPSRVERPGRPPEFSPALVPRGPRKPSPLVAHAQPPIAVDT